jgi:polysaccharide biosynthesis protein PslH
MRCLILSPFLPAPAVDGGRMRVAELAAGLAEHHEVHLLALTDAATPPGAAAELAARGLHVHTVPFRADRARAAARALAEGRSLYGTLFRSAAYQARLERLLGDHAFDVVQCEFSYMAPYVTAAAAAPGARRVPWVLDEHNVEHRLNERLERAGSGLAGLVYRGYAGREQRLRRREELAACRAADHVLAVSDVDRDQLAADLPGLRVTVVPNGVDLDRYRPAGVAGQEAASAVFVGKMDYRPNVDAVVWFCHQVLPGIRERRPDFTFRIVGSSPSRQVTALAALPGVEVTGPVADVRPFLGRATLAVVPLRAGSGTRLKILEAMAAGRAVVSTTVGCEGLRVVDGRHLLVADRPDQLAAAVLRLLADAELRHRLERSGRELVEQRYTWRSAVATLDEMYGELLGAPPAASTEGAR